VIKITQTPFTLVPQPTKQKHLRLFSSSAKFVYNWNQLFYRSWYCGWEQVTIKHCKNYFQENDMAQRFHHKQFYDIYKYVMCTCVPCFSQVWKTQNCQTFIYFKCLVVSFMLPKLKLPTTEHLNHACTIQKAWKAKLMNNASLFHCTWEEILEWHVISKVRFWQHFLH